MRALRRIRFYCTPEDIPALDYALKIMEENGKKRRRTNKMTKKRKGFDIEERRAIM